MSVSGNSAIHPHNLPASLSTFIGRQQEMSQVRELLSQHRLLTLTGVGGSGKTRLALRVADNLLEEYRDGVWLTEFASLARPELVPQAVATALGVREQSGQHISQSLISHLQSHTALLIFDNCEHLAAACAQLAAALLTSCLKIRLLATSREPLGIPGEAVWIVPPLSLPAPQPWRSPISEQEMVNAYHHQSEAIQLFVARAQTASPNFNLTVENAPWVADICRRLDGMPLAIELAAARVRTFSARQLSERLDDRFRLLTSPQHFVPARHQTLAATLDWSYALLSAAEKETLQQLSVFALGWTLEAAEAVCAGDNIKSVEVMNLLSNLVDKSLVVVDAAHGRRRYRLQETIRQYAQEKLALTGNVNVIRDRHLDYFLHWAEAGAVNLTGPEQSEWLEHFDAEHDNLRAALDWSQTSGDVQKGLRLAGSCGHFWRLRGHLGEGRKRLAAALGQVDAQERTAVRAWALLWSANLAYLQSDYPETQSLAEEALAICRELGEEGRMGVAKALDLLGELATEVGDYELAPQLLADALEIYREQQDKRGIADMLLQLGWAAMRAGDYDEAVARMTECLALFRELDESAMLALALAGLGELNIRQGRYGEADEQLQKSLALRRQIGDRWGIATALGSLGWVALCRRDFSHVLDMLQQSLTIRMEIGDRGGIAWCLEKLAETAVLQAEAFPTQHRQKSQRRAVCILGAAAGLRQSLNSTIDPVDQPDYGRLLAKLRGTLNTKTFETAWEEGQNMPVQEVVKLALTPVLAPDEADTLSGAQSAKAKFGGLTPRERETAILIAQGKTNRDIAAIMVLRVKTVETYVTRILNKLGFDSRVQIATWVLQVGLGESNSGDSSS